MRPRQCGWIECPQVVEHTDFAIAPKDKDTLPRGIPHRRMVDSRGRSADKQLITGFGLFRSILSYLGQKVAHLLRGEPGLSKRHDFPNGKRIGGHERRTRPGAERSIGEIDIFAGCKSVCREMEGVVSSANNPTSPVEEIDRAV